MDGGCLSGEKVLVLRLRVVVVGESVEVVECCVEKQQAAGASYMQSKVKLCQLWRYKCVLELMCPVQRALPRSSLGLVGA